MESKSCAAQTIVVRNYTLLWNFDLFQHAITAAVDD